MHLPRALHQTPMLSTADAGLSTDARTYNGEGSNLKDRSGCGSVER